MGYSLDDLADLIEHTQKSYEEKLGESIYETLARLEGISVEEAEAICKSEWATYKPKQIGE
jgi:hypothetical protein